ncbi:MAG TPA: hypothetical protein V6C84_27325 [Coleofasciculaceae cyanobacterium]
MAFTSGDARASHITAEGAIVLSIRRSPSNHLTSRDGRPSREQTDDQTADR